MKCSNCDTELAGDFKFCPHCGQPVHHGENDKAADNAESMAVFNDDSPNMITVPGGTFIMGTGEFVHNVLLDPFFIAEAPVTQKQYKFVMGKNPSKLVGENRPVECVNWCDALIYCNRLSMMQNLVPCYSIGNIKDLTTFESSSPVWKRVVCDYRADGYRLPTEAEWEYAARGAVKSNPMMYAGSDNIENVAWYGENSEVRTHDVGCKKPNSIGLYDMCGNVAEWCWDFMDTMSVVPQTNPHGPQMGTMHIKRGGSWLDDPQQCTVFYRSGSAPGGKSSNLGFRVCQSMVESD